MLLISNDTDFIVDGLRDSRAARGTYLNAATIHTWELNPAKKATSPVAIASGSMDYVAGSNGRYIGGLDDSVALIEGTEYWVYAVLTDGITATFEESFTASRRTGRTPTR